MRDNVMLAYPPEDFDADIIAQRILWRRIFVVNEPDAIRHVLLDNAANYTKTESPAACWSPASAAGCSPARARPGAGTAASWRRPSTIAASSPTRRS